MFTFVRSAGKRTDKDEEQTGRTFSTPFEQFDAAPERGLLFGSRHLLEGVIKDTDEGQPGREGDPNRVRLDIGEEEIDGVDFGRAPSVKVIVKMVVRLK